MRSTNIPYVVSERNDPNHRNKIKQLLLNLSYRRSNGCVFQTYDALRWYGKRVSNKSIVIHNPVNISFNTANVSNEKKQILYVGRLTSQKNVMMLIDAFAIFSNNHREFTLKIIGNGELEGSLRNYILAKGLEKKVSICLSSKTWQHDEFDSSLFVLPSKFEGMPNVLAEALCLGIPSVATNCTIGGPKELKKFFPELLTLCNSNNPQDFADSMECGLKVKRTKPGIPVDLQEKVIGDKWLDFIAKIKAQK